MKENKLKNRLLDSELGKKSDYYNIYDPSKLFKIKREYAREEFGNEQFFGYDIWNCYELSWLNANNLPVVGILQIIVPCDSDNIIESKSLKLYLNSFNNLNFDNKDLLQSIIQKDMKENFGSNEVNVKIFDLDRYAYTSSITGIDIDKEDVNIINLSEPDGFLLTTQNEFISEVLYSNIFRSICPITHQPDFATIVISYTGAKICKKSLLSYICSFRKHGGFHEKCVEKFYFDLMRICKPQQLLVYAHYTRRGGIDICPYRANHKFTVDYKRFERQ